NSRCARRCTHRLWRRSNGGSGWTHCVRTLNGTRLAWTCSMFSVESSSPQNATVPTEVLHSRNVLPSSVVSTGLISVTLNSSDCGVLTIDAPVENRDLPSDILADLAWRGPGQRASLSRSCRSLTVHQPRSLATDSRRRFRVASGFDVIRRGKIVIPITAL